VFFSPTADDFIDWISAAHARCLAKRRRQVIPLIDGSSLYQDASRYS
jgi:hypothetical protein